MEYAVDFKGERIIVNLIKEDVYSFTLCNLKNVEFRYKHIEDFLCYEIVLGDEVEKRFINVSGFNGSNLTNIVIESRGRDVKLVFKQQSDYQGLELLVGDGVSKQRLGDFFDVLEDFDSSEAFKQILNDFKRMK